MFFFSPGIHRLRRRSSASEEEYIPIRDRKNTQICKSDSQRTSPSQANKLVSQLRRDNRKSKTASLAIAQLPQNLNPHSSPREIRLCLHCCWLFGRRGLPPGRRVFQSFLLEKWNPIPNPLAAIIIQPLICPTTPPPSFFISISPAVELSEQLNLPLSL